MTVLVDESVAGGVSSDRLARPIRDDHMIVGCALAERSVGSVGVVVLDVVGQELFELRAVPDEGPVAEFSAYGVDPSFRVGVCDWCAWWGADDGGAVAAEHLIERHCCVGARSPRSVRVA